MSEVGTVAWEARRADKAEARVDVLEAALLDAWPFVLIGVARYAHVHALDGLHEDHARIADNIARLIGSELTPSQVLGKR